jgi:tetratricopeptide (TPR) repeat protein
VRLVVESLAGINRLIRPVDSARLAVELGRFRKAVSILQPSTSELDDNALVSLALALEGIGQGTEALRILEAYYKGGNISSLDALGTLAGRIKRRWLVARASSDYYRAKELYKIGLEQAELYGDHDQAFYHAINVAFLELLGLPVTSAVSPSCRALAERAMEHCKHCAISQWRLATQGEALLILGDSAQAFACYDDAIKLTSSQRDIDSMYSQAFRVAERIYGQDGLLKVEQTFGLHN